MKKDIEIPKVDKVSVAVVKELNEEKTHEIYNVYLLNFRDSMLKNVLISSKGYGENKTTGEKINTSVLRHFIGDVEGNSYAKIEPIVEDVFGVNNEYWVSFYSGNQMYDKKYIFLAESILDENMINIPILNQKGVMI
ncbi:hypothetical protein [Crocinitomix catalasitica]|uniref:hypothetical protein n=1 Tax=Crocinitomix catalasitica TaxID=184607 RepID=UPI000483255D|nr:hypothetical protein [Crocinitomix catalasitica]